MKKLSKILVIVLTLAMLLGVVVVSASALDKAADVLDEKGDIIDSYDSIYDAIDAANGNIEKGDVTVKINKNVTLSKAVTITRNAEEYGKVIIDLNGYTLTTDATNTYTALGTVINDAKGAGKIVPYINVKADKDADPKAYMLEGFAFKDGTAATDLNGNPVTVDDLVAGGTYIGTASVAKDQSYALPTLTFKRGALNVGADASLEVAGNGGQITRKATSNVFHIESDAKGAELYVHDLTIPETAAAYIAQVNNGVATFDNVYLYSDNSASIIRHGGGEINIKNSYLYMLCSGTGNVAMIRTQGTNAEKAADGYHIEITNTTMICASYVFASAHTGVAGGSSAFGQVKPTSDSTQKTFYAPHDVPLVGETYVNTDFLVENSNVEVVNYQGRVRSDNNGLVGYSGFMNFDFKKTNILLSQRGINYGLAASADPGVLNFYDCYIELTGKGNLNNAMNATFVAGTSSATVNFYYTEFAVSETYEKNGNPKGGTITPDTLFPAYSTVNFYFGCKFDKTSAPTTNNLKARIVGGKYLANDAGDIIVSTDYAAAGVDGLLDFTENNMEALNPATTGTAFNPIVILSGGNKLTNAGADTTSRRDAGEISAKAWNLYVAQGIQKVGVDTDGNKYSYWDPHYVKNDMSGYTYTAAVDFSDAVNDALPAGVTAVGGWDIDKDGVIEYLDTDVNDNEAEYVNIATNSSKGYSWTPIPDSYEQNYVSGSSPYFTIGAKSFYAPEYQYVTYSFDYKTADDSNYFVPIKFSMQGRPEFGNSGVSGSQLTKIMSNGDVYVNNTKSGKTLNPDSWNNITLLMEIKETVVDNGKGHYVDKTTRGDISFKNSVIHVFVNGEKAGSYACGFQDAHGWIVNLRGALESDAAGFTNGAQMCIDNVRNVGYRRGYQSSELDALLAGTETDLDTWSASIFNIHENYEINSFPEAKAPVASLTITPPVASASWKDYKTTTDTTRFETEVRATTFTFDSIEDAIAHGGYGNKIAHVGYSKLTVELLAGGEKIFVDAPANIETNGNKITYYSSEYKGTLNEETGILSFTRATAADLIEVTYSYADEEGEITETFIKGGSFWLDLDRIPTLLKKFDLENARDLKLAFNGDKLSDEFDPADFAAAQVISESNNTFVFSYELEKQYGWMIYDLAGDFSGLPSDIGETYDELAERIRLIEKFWDPFENDANEETKDIPDVVLSGSVYVPNPKLYSLDENAQNLRTNGYTIKLFKDFEDAERIYALNSTAASKTVNYDLNGHTVTYTNGLIFAYGAEVAWEIDTVTGEVLEYHGSRMNGNMPTTKQNVKVKSDSPKFATVLSYTQLYVNVISSEPGAKIISSGSTAIITSDRQEKVNCANTAGATGKFQPITNHQLPQIVLGNAVAASHTDIGPDANVIDIVAPLVYHVGQYDINMLNCVQNVNVISDKVDGMLSATNAKHSIKNCNFIYTNAKGNGLLTTGTGTVLFTVTKCNFISLSETNLFAKAAGRVKSSSQYVDFSNSRFYNVALDSDSVPSWSSEAAYSDAYDEVITFGLDCYYNIKFAPKWDYSLKSNGNHVETVPFRLAASRAQDAAKYQANVYVNETVSINGVDYTFTYKVVENSDVVSVNWADKDGVVFATDSYVNGAQLVYDKASTKYDDITRSKYVYENLDVASPDLIVKADDIKFIPGFAVKTNLNLETNFKHNIKIFRYVTDENGNLVDAFANVTSVSIGGQVVELALNLGEDEEAGTADDYYYYTVNVKSNAILKTYDLVINFKALDGTPVTVEQTLSVTKYLEQGFAAEIYGGDLYNMYASIVNYGIASYKNFAGTAVGEVAALEALANKYPANVVELPKAEAGAAGENLNVEFVLDEKLEYRFYLTGIGADFMEFNNIIITYTDIEGVERIFSTAKKNIAVENSGEIYWVDFTVPAYNFLADINIVVDNEAAGVYADVTYNLASYYADVQGSEAELIALTEALYNYAYYAKAYMQSNNK